ncbi:hypothetical protein [Streptomyces tailanensis]|uniref:hypothetical protein n=1 Tax=Streptomyces tailanensis TaxID=2569858 RepID=UPI001FEA6A94|nr:hypothetical protein [Streptomyces tailanensis]
MISPYAGQVAGGNSADLGTTNGIVIAAWIRSAIPMSTSSGLAAANARPRSHQPRTPSRAPPRIPVVTVPHGNGPVCLS